ncbi:Transcriptional activator flo8 [Maudiozyma exigua]|uniref:Transcriptional activator flo8 n=1 Tax=Maudiozyma exigua TaxID=34358 RepID=A0A9P6W263_MAUEX|nr:Transcriptional activator flo8 [Kazachstania exigua]
MDNKFVSQQNQGDSGSPDSNNSNNPNYQQFQQQFQMSQQMAQRMSQQQYQQQQMMGQQHQHIPGSTVPPQQHINNPNVMNSTGMNYTSSIGSSTSSNGTPANIEQLNNQKRLLNTYIQDFLLKSNLKNSAESFSKEAEMSSQGKLNKNDDGQNSSGSSASPGGTNHFKPLYDTQQGFLYEWWQLFWDLFNIKSNRDGSEIAQVYYQIINSQRQLEQIQRNIAIQAAKTQYIAERRGEYKNESLEPMELAQLLSKQPALMNGMGYQRSMNSPMSNTQYVMPQQQQQQQQMQQAQQAQQAQHVQRQSSGYIPSRTSQQMRAPMQGSMTNSTASPVTTNNGNVPTTNTQRKKQLLQQRQQQIQQQQIILQQQQQQQQQMRERNQHQHQHQQQQQGYGTPQVPPNQFPMNQQQQQNYDMSMNGPQQQAPYNWNQKNSGSMSVMQQPQQMSPHDTTRSNTQGIKEKRSRNEKNKQDSSRSHSASAANSGKSFGGTPGSSYRNQYANDNTTGNPMNQNSMIPATNVANPNTSFSKSGPTSKRKASTQKEKGKTTRQAAKKKRSTSANNNNTAANASAANTATTNNYTGSNNNGSVVSTPVDTKDTPNFTFAENKNIHNTPGTMKKMSKRSFSTTQLGSGISDPNSPRTVSSTHGPASTGLTSNKKDMLPPNGVSPHVIYSPQYKMLSSQSITPRNPVPESLSKEPSKTTQTRRKSTTSLNNKLGAPSSNVTNNNDMGPSASAGNNISWEPLVSNFKNGKNNGNNKFSTSEPVTPLYSSIAPPASNSAKQSSQLSTVDEQSAFHEMDTAIKSKKNALSAKTEKNGSTTSKSSKGKSQKANRNSKQGGTSDHPNSSKSSVKDTADATLLGRPEGIDTSIKGNRDIGGSNDSNNKHSSALDVHDNIAHNYNTNDASTNYMFGNNIADDDMLFMNTIMDNDKDHFGMNMNMNMGMGADMDIQDTNLLNKDLHPTSSQNDSKKDQHDDQLNHPDDMDADNDFPFDSWA